MKAPGEPCWLGPLQILQWMVGLLHYSERRCEWISVDDRGVRDWLRGADSASQLTLLLEETPESQPLIEEALTDWACMRLCERLVLLWTREVTRRVSPPESLHGAWEPCAPARRRQPTCPSSLRPRAFLLSSVE